MTLVFYGAQADQVLAAVDTEGMCHEAIEALSELGTLASMLVGGLELPGWKNEDEVPGRIDFWIEELQWILGRLEEMRESLALREEKAMSNHQLLSAKINWANTRHTSISVYNRGAFCGNLVVLTEDAERVLSILTEKNEDNAEGNKDNVD